MGIADVLFARRPQLRADIFFLAASVFAFIGIAFSLVVEKVVFRLKREFLFPTRAIGRFDANYTGRLIGFGAMD